MSKSAPLYFEDIDQLISLLEFRKVEAYEHHASQALFAIEDLLAALIESKKRGYSFQRQNESRIVTEDFRGIVYELQKAAYEKRDKINKLCDELRKINVENTVQL